MSHLGSSWRLRVEQGRRRHGLGPRFGRRLRGCDFGGDRGRGRLRPLSERTPLLAARLAAHRPSRSPDLIGLDQISGGAPGTGQYHVGNRSPEQRTLGIADCHVADFQVHVQNTRQASQRIIRRRPS
jgi:hypothetical protein